MEQTVAKLQSKLLREYYKDFTKYSKGQPAANKVAWVTAFTPVEILEALGVSYYYPESYAAVIAASGKEQLLIERSEKKFLSRDCCSYSSCFNGCLETGDGPRGIPPKPDILIATNNQCNTLPNWWNALSLKYQVPLVVIDYPGETDDKDSAFEYVNKQHMELIRKIEALSGNSLDTGKMGELISNSCSSVAAWRELSDYLPKKEIRPTRFFDDIAFLITERCKPDTAVLYKMMANDLREAKDADPALLPVFWLGYPLWYHPARYLPEVLEGCRICGSNYITWWNLDYTGANPMEQLFSAYNYTFLNLGQSTRNRILSRQIERSGAACAITLHNKSCKCDFVSARNVGVPQAELEIDMIDRTFLDLEKAKQQIRLLKESICIE